jgi:electron transport complex protein RnfC
MKTFSHGIHPDEAKDLTATRPVRRVPFAPNFVVHLAQNTGTPARSIVQPGQQVSRGQVIARPEGFVSVPVHSPVTGRVKAVANSFDHNGNPSPSILIEADPASTQDVVVQSYVNLATLTPEQITQAIRDMGMVGLGGAAFPTHVKLSPPKGKTIETVILNGAECEPYLTSDHRVMLEQPENIILGAKLMLRATKAKEVVIAIEANKADAIEVLTKACADETNIRVEVFRTKYPQGAEKMLTKALLGKEVPSGGLPVDIGVMISNIATAAEIGNLLPKGMGLIERVVTITGDGIANPGNYLIPIGTPLSFILKTLGTVGTPYKVIFGGPMMGKTVSFLDSPVTKGTSGIIILAEQNQEDVSHMYPCIRCGSCVDACPMHLVPSRLGLMARSGEYDAMVSEHHLMDCFECGCCSFVCPSNIPLVQQFRISKQIARQRKSRV